MPHIPLKFFTKVYIIESPKKEEMEKGVSEGVALSRSFCEIGIKHELFTIEDKTALSRTIQKIAEDVSNIKPSIGAITIQMSMHGNDNEIGLMSGERVTWKELADILSTLLKVASVPKELCGVQICPLTLCFSTCHGLSAKKINDYVEQDVSLFHAIIGPKEKVSWEAAEKAFLEFHRHTLNGQGDLPKAIVSMNKAGRLEDVFKAIPGRGLKFEE